MANIILGSALLFIILILFVMLISFIVILLPDVIQAFYDTSDKIRNRKRDDKNDIPS